MGAGESNLGAIETLHLENQNLKSLPLPNPSRAALKEAFLSRNNIHKLPIGLAHLQKLDLSFNQISEISGDLAEPIASYSSLEILDLSHNSLQKFPNFLAKSLVLTHISLLDNYISFVKLSSKSVQFIDLGLNEFDQIPALPKSVTHLNLDFNKLKVITLVLPHISVLLLNNNQIHSITEPVDLSSLVSLCISHNELTSLPKFKKGAHFLRKIDASFNKLTVFPKLNRYVCEVNLEGNQLGSLPATISQMSCLVSLNVARNRISKFPPLPSSLKEFIAFDNNAISADLNLPMLSVLFLHNNRLTSIPLSSSVLLTEFYFSDNKISAIKNLIPLGAQRVDLSNNKIEALPDSLFQCEHLISISAVNNSISSLSFTYPKSKPISLNFSINPIASISEGVLLQAEELFLHGCNLSSLFNINWSTLGLVELDVSNNCLDSVPSIPTLRVLSAQRNRINKVPDLPSIETLNLAFNLIETLDGNFQSLSVADFSFNLITKVSLSQCPCLKVINLMGNPLRGEIPVPSSLLSLNLIGTNANPTTKVVEVFGSSPSSFLTRRFCFVQWSSYSTNPSTNDLIVVKEKVFSMFPNTSNCGSEIDKFCESLNKESFMIGEPQFKGRVVELFQRTDIMMDADFDGFGLVCLYKTAFYVALCGNVSCCITTSNGEVKYIEDQFSYRFSNPNRTYGVHYVMADLSRMFRMGKRDFTTSCIPIGNGEKFVILMSGGVREAIELEHFKAIIRNFKSASDLACDLRSASYAFGSTGSNSVIVIDVAAFLSQK